MSDTDKKVTLGDPDGPDKFIDYLGMTVPTYIDPREDLLPPAQGRNTYKRVNHHVPFKMRNEFVFDDWPEEYKAKVAGTVKLNLEGFVMCHGITKEKKPCSKRAVNRTHFCRNHGGALHPADKKLSANNIIQIPERAAQLDRVQQFCQGFLDVADLDDDEVRGSFVRNNDGVPISTGKLGVKFEQILHKELLKRLNKYIRTKAPRAIEVMYQIADSDVYEAADRIKASQWLAERVVGKTPDIVLSGEINETPFQNILMGLDAGSREDYRKKVEATRYGEDSEESQLDSSFVDGDFIQHSSVLDVEVIDDCEEPEPAPTSVAVDNIAQEREQRKADIKEARDRIKKAKSRRYAARATGATTLQSIPFLLKYKEIKTGDLKGCYRLRLVAGSTASPAVIDSMTG